MAVKVDPARSCCGHNNPYPLLPEPCLQLVKKLMVSCFKELETTATEKIGLLFRWISSLSCHAARSSQAQKGKGVEQRVTACSILALVGTSVSHQVLQASTRAASLSRST